MADRARYTSVSTVGSGPDVLFVHGWPVSGATFRLLLPHLDEQDRAVAELQQASRQLDALGAIRYRDEAEREPPDRAPVERLTAAHEIRDGGDHSLRSFPEHIGRILVFAGMYT